MRKFLITNLMTLLIIGATPAQGNAIDFSQQKLSKLQGTSCEQLDQVINGDGGEYKCVANSNQELQWEKNLTQTENPAICKIGATKKENDWTFRCKKNVNGEATWYPIPKFSLKYRQPLKKSFEERLKENEIKKLQKNHKIVNDMRKNMKKNDKSYNYNLAPGN